MAVERYTLRRSLTEPRFRIDYEAELNEGQLTAVRHVEGPALVIAGAGSGKTRTLVFRVARLVEIGVSPASILLLTFTRRASQAMLRRASDLVGPDCGRVAGGTFHSFANSVLRRTARETGREPGFSILDRGDSEDIIQLLRAELGLARKERRFPRKQTIAAILSMAVNRSLSLPALMESDYLHLAEHVDDLVAMESRYRDYKRVRNLFDYDDLLVGLRDLLEAHPTVAEKLSEEFRFVMVDEYQDTNRLQAEIVQRLVSTHQNVMAVGDEAQSIYSFRGADFRNIMDFPRLFPETEVILLERNYRSTQPILDFANAVIGGARERYTKILRTDRGGGDLPLLVQAGTENEQSRFICQRILELLEEGVPLDEIAVLFRSGFHAFDLEVELGRAEIPFVKRGGFRFVESAHVKDLLAHLRVLVNPHDAVSWMRLLGLFEGVGPRTAAEVIDHLQRSGGRFEALGSVPRRGPWSESIRVLGVWLADLADRNVAPGEAIESALGHYQPILERLYSDDYPRRLRDLEHLCAIAHRYRALESMLSDFALEPPSDSTGGGLAEDDGEGRLTLSTIHSAKGLEWNTVFLLWAAEGKFPAFSRGFDEEGLEEERRLFYVALTRAKQRLYVSYPVHFFERGQGQVYGQPSRFMDGLPDGILKPVAIVEEPFE
jgi:DNA helicase-2/ATP-dependent DNA helicase PcrA